MLIYFGFMVHGYYIVAGLFFTYLGLYLMNGHGQPALLYLVPCTLGTAIIPFVQFVYVAIIAPSAH